MIDIKLIRENPEVVKENIKKKFQDEKLVLVDEVADMDKQYRAAKTEGDGLRADRNRLSKEIGGLMKQGKRDEAETVKQKVKDIGQRLEELEALEAKLESDIKDRMMIIPKIIDPAVPIG
jgi:seryl-tRNA synthetase